MSKQWWQTEENDSVATKRELWQPIAKRIGGFDLDPAAGCEPTPIAQTRYTKADDGLSQPWFGNVWLNPPFSDKGAWYQKLVREYQHGNVDRAVSLTNAGVDTNWFHEYTATADLLVLLNGRGWYAQRGTENFASILGVWNPTDKLDEYLDSLGTVVKPRHKKENTTLIDYE